MIWTIYRLILCTFMAFFVNDLIRHMIYDQPTSSTTASVAYILACLMLWERLTISLKIQNYINQHGNKK